MEIESTIVTVVIILAIAAVIYFIYSKFAAAAKEETHIVPMDDLDDNKVTPNTDVSIVTDFEQVIEPDEPDILVSSKPEPQMVHVDLADEKRKRTKNKII